MDEPAFFASSAMHAAAAIPPTGAWLPRSRVGAAPADMQAVIDALRQWPDLSHVELRCRTRLGVAPLTAALVTLEANHVARPLNCTERGRQVVRWALVH